MKPTHTHVSPRRAPTAGWSGDGSGVRAAFTMVELLVVIVIIGIMAGMVLGALNAARNTAREAATKATITKLNAIVMQKYESFMTRRLYVDTAGLPPVVAAQYRLFVLHDLMRMEMPERRNDSAGTSAYPDTSAADMPLNIARDLPVDKWSWPTGWTYTPPGGADPNNWTIQGPNGTFTIPRKLPPPALATVIWNSIKANPGDADGKNGSAEALYRLVSLGSPEAMEQFNHSEIGDTDQDACPEFLDGWGRPIYFLRWAPGFSNWKGVANPPAQVGYSEIQTGNPTEDHDPFDTSFVDAFAFELIPLIYSSGANDDPQIDMGYNYTYDGTMFSRTEFMSIGTPQSESAAGNITNHNIDIR